MRALQRDGVLLEGPRDRQRRPHDDPDARRTGELGPADSGASVKRVAIYFPAVFLDAPQPGEYVKRRGQTSISCNACGFVQPVGDLVLIHPCASEACAEVAWVELVRERELTGGCGDFVAMRVRLTPA